MKERFAVLDIFRGIFSSLVVLFHLSAFSATPIINNDFIYNSDLFVDFFFVLSGFVIAYSYQHLKTGAELKRFFKKRFFRLYPLHFIVLILFVLVEVSKHSASGFVHVNKVDNVSNNSYTFLTNLFLVNSVKFPGINDFSWNIASWSISAEMIAYMVFGFTMLLINRYSSAALKTTVYITIAILAGAAMYLFTGSFKLTHGFDYGFLRGIIGFSLGVCNGNYFKEYGFIFEALFFITILIFAFEKGWVSDLLKKSSFLHSTGKYSYSIYMIHTLILSLFNIAFIRVLKLPPSAYAYLFILNYAIIWFLSAWTFKHIEMRFNYNEKREGKKGWWVW
jgi:peptidoglycan/LPS O-acetylase OafA/YrhL